MAYIHTYITEAAHVRNPTISQSMDISYDCVLLKYMLITKLLHFPTIISNFFAARRINNQLPTSVYTIYICLPLLQYMKVIFESLILDFYVFVRRIVRNYQYTTTIHINVLNYCVYVVKLKEMK